MNYNTDPFLWNNQFLSDSASHSMRISTGVVTKNGEAIARFSSTEEAASVLAAAGYVIELDHRTKITHVNKI